MKKSNLGILVLALLMVPVFSGRIQAADDAKAQLEKIAAKKAELNDHEWNIKLSSASDKSKVSEDTLVFKDQMFESKTSTEKGYKPTNYTVSLQEGGPTVWESMQSLEDGKVVFWRGEWEGESMRGVMSRQIGDGKNDDYYFSSVSSKVIEKAPEPVKEEVPAEVQAAAADAVAEVKEAADQGVAAVEKAADAAKEEAAAPAPEAPKKKKWF